MSTGVALIAEDDYQQLLRYSVIKVRAHLKYWNMEDAEDLLHDALSVVVGKVDVDNPVAYTVAVIKKMSLSYRRKYRREDQLSGFDQVAHSDLIADVLRSQQVVLLAEQVKDLSPQPRAVFEGLLAGLTQDEIMAEQGLTAPQYSRAKWRGLEQIKGA